VAALGAGSAGAGEVLRAPDAQRLAALSASLGVALRGALATGAEVDIAVVTEALRGKPGALAPGGDWRCRTVKMGGGVALAVYPDFACTITAAGPGQWRLVKTTGSQRMAGDIRADAHGALYTGVGNVAGGPAVAYAALPARDQTPVEPGQTVAQVGIFEQMGPDRARLLLPDPILESRFDILYLTR
jgi:hypothetical protein